MMFEYLLLAVALAVPVAIYFFKNKSMKPGEWIWLGEGENPVKEN